MPSSIRSKRSSRIVAAASLAGWLVQLAVSRGRTAAVATAADVDPWWDDLGVGDDDIAQAATTASAAAWRQRTGRTALPASRPASTT